MIHLKQIIAIIEKIETHWTFGYLESINAK